MKTNNSKPYFSKMTLISLACAASLGGAATDAQAQNLGQCLKDTVGCGVNIAKTQIDILTAATDVLAFTVRYPHCVSDIAAGNFITIGISGSMVTLAAAGVLKQEGGSYTNYIYGQASRPIVQAISSIVPVPALSNLLNENDAELVRLFPGVASAIPIPSVNAPTLERQLDCGNAIATTGQAMVGKVKNFVGHAKGAVKSCSAAASCFAGVLLDIVKDPVGALGSAGEFLVDGADSLKDAVFGGCKNQDTQLFFNANIKPWQNDIAYKVIWGGQPDAYNVKATELVNNCVSYYDGCNSDKDTAQRQCTVMSTGAVQSDGNGWIAGKGLEQLVRTRQMELRIPQFLATDMKWALAQPTGGKDTAMLNQQFARLPAQLQPLVKAKFNFSFKPAREAAVRKIMGFAPGYSGNGDFGGKDAKVAMADQSIGALMLAYVPTQGAENQSTNTKINDLYKQYIPNGDALLQQIEATVGESMGKAMAEVVKQNGDAWNEAFTNTQLQKMVKRLDDCKNAHKDAQKTCKQNISDAIQFTYTAMTGLGKVNNYAGIGALGAQNPAHLSYLKFIQDADNTVGKHVAHSGLVMLGENQVAASGTASAPSSAAPVNIAAKPPAPPAAPSQSVMLAAPVLPAGGIANTPVKPSIPNASPVGMPSAPVMGVVPMNANRNPPKPVDLAASSGSKPPGIMVAVNVATPPPGGAVVASQTPASDKQAVTPSNNNAPPKSVVDLLPFDATAYRKVREKQIEDEWFPKCSAQPQCLKTMDVITEKLLNAEVAALKAGTPLHTDKAAVAVFQNSLDPIYDPQFKSAVPKVVVASQPPTGQAMTNNPASTAKSVVALLPFDPVAYRRVREKEIKDEWLPKCGVIVICQRKMDEITQNLLGREVAALTNGTPLHTDKAAVAAFQNSLDPIFDPQFKAAIPPTATTATTPSGPSTFSNKKPDFKPKL